MIQADTIVYDAGKIAGYQSDSRYDYLSQLELPDYTWFDMVARWFNRLINFIFSGRFGENVTTPLMIIIFLLILSTIIYFLYKKRPELFMRSRKATPLAYSIEEENIRLIQFDKEIDAAIKNGDYRLAIRLLYLQTLRFFSDNQLIDWQIHKTPMEYLYELSHKEMRQPFRVFTNHFLHVRYGNYQASPQLFETLLDLQSEIKQMMKGGTT